MTPRRPPDSQYGSERINFRRGTQLKLTTIHANRRRDARELHADRYFIRILTGHGCGGGRKATLLAAPGRNVAARAVLRARCLTAVRLRRNRFFNRH